MCISVFTAGLTFRTPYFLTSNNDNHKFQFQNIKNTELSKYIKTSPDRTYLIFCFSYTCPHCWNSIENLRSYIRTKAVDSVVVLSVGEQKDRLVFEQNFKPDFTIKELSAGAMDKLTMAYPTTFYVANDTVKIVIQSELPSAFTLNKMINIPKPK